MAKNNPVFTDRQQRQTLSAKIKKKPPKTVLKSVLAQPMERFWPEIQGDETKSLIANLLQIASRTNVAAGSFLKSCKIITVGLKESLRNLKSGNIDVLLISADIRPKFIVEQVIQLAIAHNADTKIICALELTTHIAQHFSLPSCVCLSFSSTQADEQFAAFYSTVNRMTSRYPIPRHLSELAGKLSTTMEPVRMDIEKPCNNKPMPSLRTVALERFYLVKPAESSGRCFVPNGSSLVQPSNTADLTDFISLGSDSVEDCKTDAAHKPITYHIMQAMVNAKAAAKKKQHKRVERKSAHVGKVLPTKASHGTAKYVSLTVHKVQGNPNKVVNKKKKKKNKKQPK